MSHTVQFLGDECLPIVGRVSFVNSGHCWLWPEPGSPLGSLDLCLVEVQ